VPSKKNSEAASEVGVRNERVGAKPIGLLIKMRRSLSVRVGNTKSVLCVGVREWEMGGYLSKALSILLVLGRAGLLNSISFFCLIIGF
jgi:hypothetical protein